MKISASAKIADPEVLALIKDLEAELIRRAIARKIRKTAEELIVRTLTPTDLGFLIIYSSQTITAAYDYNKTVDFTLPDDVIIAIFGIKSKLVEPLTTVLKFWKNITPLIVTQIEKIETEKIRELILETPIIWEAGERIRIDQYARATGTDEIVYLGLICEPKGKLITGETGYQEK